MDARTARIAEVHANPPSADAPTVGLRRPDGKGRRAAWGWIGIEPPTCGGSLAFDHGFNVKTGGDSPAWHESEVDLLPGQKPAAG